jgi:hypothetical protein
MGKIYSAINGPAPGAAATPKVTTSAAVKTLLQFATSANREARIVQHWIEMDGSSAATPFQYELLKLPNLTTPATVTAFVAADITKVSDQNSVATQITLGTTASGYTGSAEGTLVNPVTVEQHLVPPTSGIYIQFPLGREPEVAISSMARQRVTGTPAVNAICGIMWEE